MTTKKWIVVLMSLWGLLMLWILWPSKSDRSADFLETNVTQEIPQEEMAESLEPRLPITPKKTQPSLAAPGEISKLVSSMAKCLILTTEIPGENFVLSKDSLGLLLQKDLGPVLQNEERWQEWRVLTSEGQKQNYRLELAESDEGQPIREIFAYALNADGLPEPVDLTSDLAYNPTEEQVLEALKDKTIESHEKAGSLLFPRADRLEYLERAGELSEFELIRGDITFRCKLVETSQPSCQCMR